MPHPETPATSSLRDVYYILFRRIRLAAWTFGALALVTTVLVCLQSEQYRSEARVLVRLGRESVALDRLLPPVRSWT